MADMNLCSRASILSPGSTDQSGALISECGTYRYLLWRKWGGSLDSVLSFVMLNPSTADALKDDPTIRRCIALAKRERLGGIQVVNLFAYRSTDPAVLGRVPDPVGPSNDHFIREQVFPGRVIVVAWGSVRFQGRIGQVMGMLREHGRAYCLGTTKNGSPRHPLYLPSSTPLVSFPL